MFMARLAEQGERFEDMFEFLHPVLLKRDHFTPEERQMLSVAFKNLVTPRRTTWRTIIAIEQSKQSQNNDATTQYKAIIEERLHKNCRDIIDVLTAHVIPRVEKRYRDKQITSLEERAFFYKMVGDYNRYASESCQAVEDAHSRLNSFKQGALKAYSKALELCNRGPESGIKPYNPVKRGLALNFSVFYFEIMGDAGIACEIARSSLKAALAEIDECSEDVYQEAQGIVDLLRENLNIWQESEE